MMTSIPHNQLNPVRPAADATGPTAPDAVPAGSPTSAALPESGAANILPFRRRIVRQPNDRSLTQAVDMAVRLLTAGHVEEAERRFASLDELVRSPDVAAREAAWNLPAWVGVVVCHALRGEWLSAEMAARERFSLMATAEVAGTYIAAVELGNDWLVNVPTQPGPAPDEAHAVAPRRFPRSTPRRELAEADPARDYAYALVSALRFRLGSGAA